MIAAALVFFRKFWPYFAALAFVIAAAVAINWYIDNVRKEGYANGANDKQAEWDRAKLAASEATSKLVQAARNEEQAKQKDIQTERNKANAKANELAGRVIAFERDNSRLRVNAANLCKRQSSMPGTADSSGRNVTPADAGTVRAGPGEINLDDVAREIGRLGSDLDGANLRIVELVNDLRVCLRKPAK